MKPLFPSESNSPPSFGLVRSLLDTPTAPLSDVSGEEWKLIRLELQSQLDAETYQRSILPIKARVHAPHQLTLTLPETLTTVSAQEELRGKIESCKKRLGFERLNIILIGPAGTSLDSNAGAPQSVRSSTPQKPSPAERPGPALFSLGNTHEPHTDFPEEAIEPSTPPSEEESQGQLKAGESPALFASSLVKNARLNPAYTFANFVRGPSNQFALASCLNVAENPGGNYNPLFLYGSSGLGKTHLLHSVGNQVRSKFPELVVAYVSSERFMNEMIYCIRHNKMWDFRQKYRHCDVFLMDDIQFISGNKATTQEEFFHTFNSLYEAKKQIIITSDLFPQDIPDIEERLRNRFQWGLIADIQPPDIEHRIAILMNKAQTLGIALSFEVAEYIANHARRNVRELEGALHRIAAFAALQGRPLSRAIAMETFHSMLGEAPKQLEIDTVQKAVADRFNIRVSDLRSKKRLRTLSLPRQIAMYLARKHTQASFPDIGARFGGRDHTTVMHAVKKIASLKHKDLDLKAQLEAIERLLEQVQQ